MKIITIKSSSPLLLNVVANSIKQTLKEEGKTIRIIEQYQADAPKFPNHWKITTA